MGTSLAVLLLCSVAVAQASETIKQEEVDYQNEAFQRWWETSLVWRFEDLPTKGNVPEYRLPYSGHDYPDSAGGTIRVLHKYDRAFQRGQPLAAAFERRDTTSFQETTTVLERRGLFGLRQVYVTEERTPEWHGHCNGWTAAAIRHAEPEKNVTRNGIVFTPADIKGLLAEIYMYRDHEFLGGVDKEINPGTLHVVIANWVGRGSVPIGLDTTVGKEVWNYPLYAFASTSLKRSDHEVEVKMNVAHSQSVRREMDRSQHLRRVIYFHYMLQLDDNGDVIGGRYFDDSNRIDFLWSPLHPVQGGEEGNQRGNPHVDVKEVLAMWRESVSDEVRQKWWNIDPTEEDRIMPAEEAETDTADSTAADEAEQPADEQQ